MSGYDPLGATADLVDLDVPDAGGRRRRDSFAGRVEDDGVHATLDALGLAPIDPTKSASPATHGRAAGEASPPTDSRRPKKR
jgi:hypothetical protein